MKGIGKYLSEALFPRSYTCDICGIETFGTNICKRCFETLQFNDKITCPICGRQTLANEPCMECKDKRPKFKQAVSALIYDGGCIPLIAKFKKGSAYLKDYFADLIIKKLEVLPKPDAIIYVPMTEKAIIKREYNQSELLALSISEKTGIPVLKDAIIKVKETKEQKSLSREERAKNLKDCFQVEKHDEIVYYDILLVDDILTTGATADAISDKLLKAGAFNVYLATVASVQYTRKKNNKLIDILFPF